MSQLSFIDDLILSEPQAKAKRPYSLDDFFDENDAEIKAQQERELERRTESLRQSSVASGWEGGGALTGLSAGAISLAAPVIRTVSSEIADDAQLQSAALQAAQQRNVAEQDYGAVRGFVNRNLPGAVSSVAQAAALVAGGGTPALVAGFGAGAADASYYEGRQEGLSKRDAGMFAATDAALEVAPMLVFQGLGKFVPGAGGLEGLFLNPVNRTGVRETLKAAAVGLGAELTEESITAIGQTVNRAETLPGSEDAANWTGEDGTFFSSPMAQVLKQVAEQTILTMGIGKAVQQLAPRERAKIVDFIKKPSRRKLAAIDEQIQQSLKDQTGGDRQAAADLLSGMMSNEDIANEPREEATSEGAAENMPQAAVPGMGVPDTITQSSAGQVPLAANAGPSATAQLPPPPVENSPPGVAPSVSQPELGGVVQPDVSRITTPQQVAETGPVPGGQPEMEVPQPQPAAVVPESPQEARQEPAVILELRQAEEDLLVGLGDNEIDPETAQRLEDIRQQIYEAETAPITNEPVGPQTELLTPKQPRRPKQPRTLLQAVIQLGGINANKAGKGERLNITEDFKEEGLLGAFKGGSLDVNEMAIELKPYWRPTDESMNPGDELLQALKDKALTFEGNELKAQEDVAALEAEQAGLPEGVSAPVTAEEFDAEKESGFAQDDAADADTSFDFGSKPGVPGEQTELFNPDPQGKLFNVSGKKPPKGTVAAPAPSVLEQGEDQRAADAKESLPGQQELADTMGTAPLRGSPPKTGLVPANIGVDGQLYYGERGDLHTDLSTRYGDGIRERTGERAIWDDTGFAGPDGKFLTREEALAQTNVRPSENMEGQLDAGDYSDQPGRRQPVPQADPNLVAEATPGQGKLSKSGKLTFTNRDGNDIALDSRDPVVKAGNYVIYQGTERFGDHYAIPADSVIPTFNTEEEIDKANDDFTDEMIEKYGDEYGFRVPVITSTGGFVGEKTGVEGYDNSPLTAEELTRVRLLSVARDKMREVARNETTSRVVDQVIEGPASTDELREWVSDQYEQELFKTTMRGNSEKSDAAEEDFAQDMFSFIHGRAFNTESPKGYQALMSDMMPLDFVLEKKRRGDTAYDPALKQFLSLYTAITGRQFEKVAGLLPETTTPVVEPQAELSYSDLLKLPKDQLEAAAVAAGVNFKAKSPRGIAKAIVESRPKPQADPAVVSPETAPEASAQSAAPAVQAEAKEPWQMTRDEYETPPEVRRDSEGRITETTEEYFRRTSGAAAAFVRSDTKTPGIIYRGMSRAELKRIIRTGQVKSSGIGNIGDGQNDKTVFSEIPSQAANYASSFTLKGFRAKSNRPGYVIEVTRPDNATVNTQREIEVSDPVTSSQIKRVWELRPRHSGSSADFLIRDVTSEFQAGDIKSHTTSPHRDAVEQAIREGKQVPANVLADYPDLKPASAQSAAPAVQAETGQPFETTVFRGESQGGGGLQAQGVGTYYGLESQVAERFSKKGTVKESQVSLQNPLVIRNDAEMKAVKQEAEAATGRDFGKKGNLYEGWLLPEQSGPYTDYLKSKGHDGVVVDFKEAAGGRQVVVFDQPARDYGTLQKPNRENLAKWFETELTQGQSYPTISKARQEAADLMGAKTITPAHKSRKDVDEAIELGVVNIMRRASTTAPAVGKSRSELFDDMLDLHERHPRLGTTTSTSLQEQAFSTPVPLANAVNWMIGTNSQQTVYDSSAGNGMLLGAVPAKNATANEINLDRVAALRSQGIETNQGDATQYRPDKQFDAVIINPPFGKVEDENQVSQTFEVDGIKTNEVDHAITLNSLPAMKDNGRAVVLMGTKGVRKEGNAKKSAYLNGGGKEYYTHLYDNYNVTDHFVVDGKLYNKMGAGFPVDVIVIDGKGKSKRGYPWQDAPVDLTTWEDVKNAAQSVADQRGKAGVESTGDQQPTGRDTGLNEAEGNQLGAVPGRAPDSDQVAGEPGSGTGESVSGSVVGQDGKSAEQQSVERPSDDGGRGRPAGTESRPQPGSVPDAGEADQRPQGNADGDEQSGRSDAGTGSLTDDAKAVADAAMADIFGAPDQKRTESGLPGQIETGIVSADESPNVVKGKRKKSTKHSKKVGPSAKHTKTESANQDLKDDWDEFRDAVKDLDGDESAQDLSEDWDEFERGKQAERADKALSDNWNESERVKRARMRVAKADANLDEDWDEFGSARRGFGIPGGVPLDPRLVKATVKLTKSLIDKGVSDFNLFIQQGIDKAGVEFMLKVAPVLEYVWGELPKYGYSQVNAPGSVQAIVDSQKDEEPELDSKDDQQGDIPDAEFQMSYTPGSKMNSGGTLVPKNLEKSTREALESVVERRGDLDDFVATELGYTKAEFSDGRFMAEQVDALALAIDNHKNGAGFIIGDQTGVGKGRVVAGMMRYAKRNGMVPVFVTAKPSLFYDMMRDLIAIGESTPEKPFNILATNGMTGDGVVKLPDGRVLSGAGKKNAQTLIDAVKSFGEGKGLTAKVKDGRKKAKEVTHDGIFMTYSQFQSIDGGEESARHAPLREIASKSYFILDEAHEAGGSDGKPRKKKGKKDDGEEDALNRAAFIRELLADSPGVFYSSATFAKRPSVMDLYMATDMAKAVEGDISKLPEAVAKGGLPLQQSLSAMLAEAGQYIRRERSFDGIEFGTQVVEVASQELDDISSSLRVVSEMYDAIDTESIESIALAGGYQIHTDISIGDAGADSTEFHSVLHNLVTNMLLSLKADAVADAAIESLNKKGKDKEKPVIALSMTMETKLKEMMERDGLDVGDTIDWTFKDLLLKYLDRSREVRIKDPETNKVVQTIFIKDEDIGAEALDKYKEARTLIKSLNINAPISPIDRIRQRLKAAGKSVREITGRDYVLDYDDSGKAVISKKAEDERGNAGKLKSVDSFNDGSTDALIINGSGATGLSLHASVDFIDQTKRRMIIAEAAGNIDEFMQMLGRIHRTGQVTKPAFTMLMTSAPAENRPAAVTVKKLASLNANVTGASKGKVSFDAPDIINTIGDQVVTDWYKDNPEFHSVLGDPINWVGRGANRKMDKTDAAKKVSGRIIKLPFKEQQRFWAEVSASFEATIDSLNESGTNPLSAKALDLQAETLNSMKIFDGNDEGNSFEQPAYLEQMSVVDTVKVMSHGELNAEISKFYGKEVDAVHDSMYSVQQPWYQETIDEIRKAATGILETRLGKAKASKKSSLRQVKERISADHHMQVSGLISNLATVMPGSPVIYEPTADEAGGDKDTTRDYALGVVLSVTRPKTGNILAMSNWRAKIALDSKARTITTSLALSDVSGFALEHDIAELFPKEPTTVEKREKRWMGTGNMLAAFSQLKDGKGRVVSYTDKEGGTHTGVLMPKAFKASKWKEDQPVELGSVEVVKKYMLEGGVAVDPGRNVAVRMPHGGAALTVRALRARSRGGKYTTNKKLLKAAGAGREFISSGKWMELEVELENADAVIAEIMKVSPLQAVIRKDDALRAGGTQGSLGFGADTGKDPTRKTRPKGRTGKAETKADESAEDRGPVSHTEIRKRLEKLFGLTFKAGRVQKRWDAQYMRHFVGQGDDKKAIIPHVIRMMKQKLGDLGLMAHEISHHIDETHPELREMMPPAVKKQLRGLDYLTGRADKKTAEQEGFAEFIRMWAAAPDQATLDSLFVDVPELVTYIQDWSKKNPETAKSLEQMKAMSEKYYRQSPAQRAASQVRDEDEEDRPYDETTAEFVTDKMEQYSKQVEVDWLDQFAELKEVDTQAKKEGYDITGRSGAHDLQMAYQFAAPQHAQQSVEMGVHTVGEGQGRIISKESLKQGVERSGVKAGQDYTNAVNWMYARMTRFLHGKNPNYDSGLMIEDAEAILEGTSEADADRFRILHEALTQFNNDGLDMLVDAGVIAKSEADAMKNANPYYIPAMRITDEGSAKQHKGNLVDIQKPVRSRSKKGSDAPILDPFIASINRMQVLYQSAFDQQVHGQLAHMADNVSGIGKMIHRVSPKDVVTKVNIAEILADKEVMERLSDMGIDPQSLMMDEDLMNMAVSIFRKDLKGNKGERVIRIMVDGKPQLYQVSDALYEALDSTADALKGPVVGAFAKATNAVRTGAVGANPVFAVMNIVRDWRVFQERTRYTSDVESLVAPITGLLNYIGQRAGMKNEIIDLYREGGGLLATRYGQSADQAVEIREKALGLSPAEKQKHLIRDMGRKAVRGGHAVEGLIAIADVGPRVAEFAGVLKKHGYRKGKDGKLVNKDGKHVRPPRHVLIEAINAAAEATVNFKRRGRISSQVNKFVPFFGASMASANKQYRVAKAAFKKDPSEGNKARIWTANITIASLTALMWAFRHDDDDYEEQPDWLKYGYWTITWDGKPVYRVPRGYEESVVPNLVEGILNSLDPKSKDGIAEALWQSFTKLLPPHEVAGFSGALEVYSNYDAFRQSPIETDGMKSNTKPLRDNAWTSEFSKWLSAYGGSQILNLSPVQIDHLISKQTGGLGTKVVMGVEGAIEATTGQGTKKLKRAATAVNPLSGFDIKKDYSESIDEMYERSKLVEQQQNDLKKLGKPEDPALKEESSRFNRVKAMNSELREKIDGETDRDVRFSVEKYIIGLNRWSLGKTDLKRYPNPMGLAGLPDDVRELVSDQITKSIIRSLIETDSESEGYLQSIESAKAFLKNTGITAAQAGKLLSDHYRSEPLSRDRYSREQTILRRRRTRGRLMRMMK